MLWGSARSVDESVTLLRHLAGPLSKGGQPANSEKYLRRAIQGGPARRPDARRDLYRKARRPPFIFSMADGFPWRSKDYRVRPVGQRGTRGSHWHIITLQSSGPSRGFPRCNRASKCGQLSLVSGQGFPRSREKGPTASQIGALLRVRGLLATHRGTCRSSPPAHPCIAGALAAQAQWKSSMADNDGSLVYLVKSVP